MSAGKVVVTGVGGFVGRALAKELCVRGFEVVGLGRRSYSELEELGIKCICYDLSKGDDKNENSLTQTLSGARAVFHTAAKVDMWGRYEDFFATNVLGTRNIIWACMQEKVPYLIYTSSPSVIADGSELRNVDESYPYPAKYHAFYPMTKAMAEKEVLKAHNTGKLSTISLRPHLIFGPGDTHLIPTILKRAEEGRLLQVGRGNNRVDFTYINDCVRAHILALEALIRDLQCGGKVYFVSQGEPMNMWDWINQVLNSSGALKIQKRISKSLAYALATACEFYSRVHPKHPEPLFTRFLVHQMSSDHYFSIERARRELGYVPAYNMARAMKETLGTLG